MANWSDPAEIAKDAAVFERMIFILFGVVLWEIFSTCDFEWSLITRRRHFRWPLSNHLLFFFMCRYCIVFALIGLVLSLTIATPINCIALYTFNSWAGNSTIGAASTSLMLRTIALWERSRAILISLGVLCLAHWALLYRTMFIVHASWDDTAHVCVVTQTNPEILNVAFFFTIGFDFVTLVATFVALTSKHTARTDLWKLLFKDGLIYFLVTFSVNCIPGVLNLLNLNPVMNVIATIPAVVISSIAACRAVMRLLGFNSSNLYIHSGGPPSATRAQVQFNAQTTGKFGMTRPEVHVATEHITMADFPASGSVSKADLEHGRVDVHYLKGDRTSSEYTT